MNRLPDFTSLITSPPFTFLVGKDHTKLTIQSGLAKHVSRPLDDLMNNGHTRESKHRIAVLENEEVEVFTAFTQYAYTGNYVVPVQKTESLTVSPSGLNTASAPAPPAAASPATSPRSGSEFSGGGALEVQNRQSPTNEQQQQQSPPQNISAARTQSSASFFPPPAPTPPPFADRLDSRPPVRKYAETPLAVTQTTGEDDSWENPFASPAEQQPHRNGTSIREDTPPVENKIREVVVIQDRPPEEDGQPAFPLSRRHSRKDKKKKRKDTVVPASGYEETVPESLTPPSTPPFDVKDVQDQTITPKINKSEARDYDPDCAIETDNGEDGEIEGGDGNWWDQPVTSQNFSRRRDYEETLSDARRLQSQNQQPPQAPSPPHLSPQQHTVPLIDTSFASHPMSSTPRKKGGKSWNAFASIDYFHQERNEDSGVTTPTPSQTIIVPYILFHAKVYVFAMRYLIPGLAQLCLQKLHTSLVDYPLDPPTDNEDELNSHHALNHQQDTETLKFNAHAKMFLDILKYTYENTTRFEPESQTSATLLRECELRKLVSQYAACKMRELAVYTPAPIPVPSSPSHGPGSGVSVITAPGGGLRELLDKTPELASDLVFLMM
ncbi:conserved hypothetical protein [Talaromyces stipitatus ATCC 10500]|uniref:BTB domain-containing protein n=1 Tax=Talaromyces stipitatus (strain ATCC 10500 / CBS 375.48 / QM 6759 / NRRL 1006) TaxID=441959 RepID=B8ME28_TALSN|nr:uncharacterized protein TSTA_012140 [Talaromyces stipitatus ATCC 10500]EED16105.1 conserved hypothetical protein [Talaromyces stipitatus ATCC 10500]